MSSKLAFPHLLLSRICRFSTTPRLRAKAKRSTKCQPIQLSKNFVSSASGPSHSRWDVRPFKKEAKQ